MGRAKEFLALSLILALASIPLSAHALPLSNPLPVCATTCNQNFDFADVNYYQWTAPLTTTYTFQAWGAQGGGGINYYGVGGMGGYSKGDYQLSAGTVVYIYIGQRGVMATETPSTAYNGGGAGAGSNGFSGGGATHAALQVGLLSTLSSSQSSVIIVAGGGGGAPGSGTSYAAGYLPAGGYGGGLSGGTPEDSTDPYNRGKGTPGTQSTAGINGTSGNSTANYTLLPAAFGQGASGSPVTADALKGGGGGGGFYGGGAGSPKGGAGAGGSGFVGNLSSSQMINGNATMVQPNGTTTTGHAGSGYLRISYSIPTLSFSGYTLSNTPSKGRVTVISASLNLQSRVTFYDNNKKIPGCISVATTGSGTVTATCNWKPSVRGSHTLSIKLVPDLSLIASLSKTLLSVGVGGRITTR